jgi:hypothetical protein
MHLVPVVPARNIKDVVEYEPYSQQRLFTGYG